MQTRQIKSWELNLLVAGTAAWELAGIAQVGGKQLHCVLLVSFIL